MTISAWAGTISGTVLAGDQLDLRRRAAGRRTGIRERVSGTGVTAARMVPGSAPMTAQAGRGSRLALGLPAAVVLGAAAVGQPAHDGAVLAQHLHAVDAEVVVVLARLATGPW